MGKHGNDRPVLLGGTPAITMNGKDANKWPILTREDEEAVLKILRDGDISTHGEYRELEKDYCQFTGRAHALAHCNGTAALLAAFFALDLSPGDEILVPSATFWASVLPMLWLGLVPVFCESEEERLGLDPRDMEKKITKRTKAIVVVHLWGLPSKMTEILQIADKYGLKIIEDASHAQGATWRGRACGTLGDISVFSLQGGKLAPAGEGGILLCDEYDLYERAICLGDITRIIELQTPAWRFAATSFGIKTRMAPMSAAVARVQLRHLENNNRRRNENLEYLSTGLEQMGFHTFLAPDHIKRVYFEFLIRCFPDQIKLPVEFLIKSLAAEGCDVSHPRYPLLHQQPFFTEGHCRKIARLNNNDALPDYNLTSLPKTEMANHSLLKLPSFPTANREILDQYLTAFKKTLSHADEICRYCESLS